MGELSVIVASFRRPAPLLRCLEGLRGQTCPPNEVIVVTNPSDPATAAQVTALAADWPSLRSVQAARDGSVAAYNCGLAAARAPIVAYVDDDAVPEADWIERITGTFARDQRIAGVGGRDILLDQRPDRTPTRSGRPRAAPTVGIIQWFGRMIANHHLGSGEARDVDVLKGVNMAFRRAAVVAHGFDDRLRGPGAQVHSELSICLPLRRRGLRIVYDPSIVVRHYPALRPAGDHRGALDGEVIAAAAHNEALQILDYFGPVQRGAFAIWSLAVGSADAPGFAALARDVLRRRPHAGARFLAAQGGRLAAWRTCRRMPRHRPAPCSEARSVGAPAKRDEVHD
jgi:GT2 family glycosyltransferase